MRLRQRYTLRLSTWVKGIKSVCASINGKYRTLAAIHNQWLYGAMVIKRCLKLLEIYRASANEPDIRRELRRAERMDWDQVMSPPKLDFVRMITSLSHGSYADHLSL